MQFGPPFPHFQQNAVYTILVPRIVVITLQKNQVEGFNQWHECILMIFRTRLHLICMLKNPMKWKFYFKGILREFGIDCWCVRHSSLYFFLVVEHDRFERVRSGHNAATVYSPSEKQSCTDVWQEMVSATRLLQKRSLFLFHIDLS